MIKKLVWGILSVILFLHSGITVCAAVPENHAENRYAASSSYYRLDPKFSARYGNDGNEDTGFLSDKLTDLGVRSWWQLDMGSSCVVERITIVPRKNGQKEEKRNFTIWLSNDEKFADEQKTIYVATQGEDPFDAIFVRNIITSGSYRYLRIVKDKISEYLGFAEVKVYAEAGDAKVLGPDEKDPAWTNVAEGKPAYGSSPLEGFAPAFGVDGSADSFYTNSVQNETGLPWWYVDLGMQVQIGRIEMVRRYDIPAERRNFKIMFSNDPEFKNSVTVYEQGETGFDYQTGFNYNKPIKYRYVRVEKTAREQLGFSELRVFAMAPPPPSNYEVSAELIDNFDAAVPENEDGKLRIILDGKTLQLKQTPVMDNNYIFVSAQELVDDMDGIFTVNRNTIMIQKGGLSIRMDIGDDKAYVNRKLVNMDAHPYIEDGVTMIPVRLLSCMGANIVWNEKENTVIINLVKFSD